MADYRAPVDDMAFVLEHVVGLGALSALPRFEHADPDTVRGVLDEAARFMETELAPLNAVGDQHGLEVDGDEVRTAPGFSEAYDKFVGAGWNGMAFDPDHGGGGMPWVVGLAVQEMMTSANMAFSLCPLLTQGAIDAITHHADEVQQQTYLPRMVAGDWAGTMNLTEPQAGSDVGALTTRAVPAGDGTYRIFGTKIFITYGEHDLTENIVHLVLARTPDAPAGTKGISLFIVPKFLVRDDGSLGERNDLRVVSSEHKVGIHASPTCVMSYGDGDGAVGYLVGEEFGGMRAMFTMMNNARLSVGLQGLALTERAYQHAAEYARDRRQGLAIGAETGNGSSPIADHADVRRMLMTMRANAEAMRCVMYANAAAIDRAAAADDDAEREQADALTALLTPISKGWGTDVGVEMTSLAIQVHGGMGYVEETGVAQYWRDARIAPIYEGTNGIQAADLVFRKLPLAGGQVVRALVGEMSAEADALRADEQLADIGSALSDGIEALTEAATWLGERLATAPNDAAAGSSPFMRLAGIVVGGYYLALSARRAAELAAGGHGDPEFLADKVATARFYADQILSTAPGLVTSVTRGADLFYAIPPERL